MIITHHGISCFKITTKSSDGHERSVVLDPFNAKEAGLSSLRLKADMVLVSSDSPLHNDTNAVKPVTDQPLISITSPGEYEIADIFIQGSESENGSIAYYLEVERIKIAFLGSQSNSRLTQAQLELLENVDILLTPVGGGSVLNAKQASELTSQIEPRIVIPCFYKAAGVKVKGITDTADIFFKELGVNPDEKDDKLKITYKDLPQEELRVVELTF